MDDPLNFTDRRTILVVDDTPENLSLMSGMLRDDYKVKVAPSGARALAIATGADKPDLILLDIMMPEMDGYEVLRRLQADAGTREVPVIFLTALSDAEDEKAGLDLGAVDYITKPANPAIVLARVRNHLQLKAARDLLKDQNAWLEREVQARTREVVAVQDVTIRALASLAETRDNETGKHIRRTQEYVKALALRLQQHSRFRSELTDATIEALYKSAPLHDIGKVGIPDRILLKPGRLDADEFEVMKRHTTLGHDALLRAEEGADIQSDFLRYAREIALGHQEKWDGSGYPHGLRGEAIPISARLMALADVYDALISRRVYKEPRSHEEAVQAIVAGRDKHFDPEVVDAFLAIEGQFRDIAALHADDEAALAAQADRMIAEIGERIELRR
jgi:putative two-component system response regulator